MVYTFMAVDLSAILFAFFFLLVPIDLPVFLQVMIFQREKLLDGKDPL